jgi:hypothetical protein
MYFVKNRIGFRNFFWVFVWLLCANGSQIHSISYSLFGDWGHLFRCIPFSQSIDGVLLPRSTEFRAALS